MKMKIEFLGGSGTVSGSRYLLRLGKKNILVDCGLFQGLKSLRRQNWAPFPVEPSRIDAVILTHAHLDHSGYLPRLIKEGFQGPVYCTPATVEICSILLRDAGYLQQEEADYLNRKRRSKHNPALPLFDLKDAELAMKSFLAVDFEAPKKIDQHIEIEFRYVGHILGAASVIIQSEGKSIAFTGDIGRPHDQMLYPPRPLPQADYLVTESTYGNQLHPEESPEESLEAAVKETLERKGVVVIAAFAVGRAQSIMHYLSALRRKKRIPDVPMYLNSPMAKNFSSVFCQHSELHKLSPDQCDHLNEDFRVVGTPDESKALNDKKGPMVIISASGMLSGGRILHHLISFGSSAQNSVILGGFQAAGTRGEALKNGAKEIKIFGNYIPIRAEVHLLENMSAHADYSEIIQWFRSSKVRPKKVFVTHGEPSAADEFRRRLFENFGWGCVIPEIGQSFDL